MVNLSSDYKTRVYITCDNLLWLTSNTVSIAVEKIKITANEIFCETTSELPFQKKLFSIKLLRKGPFFHWIILGFPKIIIKY